MTGHDQSSTIIQLIYTSINSVSTSSMPVDYGLWTTDYGLQTMPVDYGLWTIDYGLNYITSILSIYRVWSKNY